MAGVYLKSNVEDTIKVMTDKMSRSLEIIGQKAESYAKGLAPVDRTGISGPGAGELRNSIGHRVDGNRVVVGSSAFFAPYVELGTGNLYEPPPEWIEAQAKRGRGLDHWVYKGGDGQWHIGYPRVGVKFLQTAIKAHIEEYKQIITNELSKER